MTLHGVKLFESETSHDFLRLVAEFGAREIARALSELTACEDDYVDLEVAIEAWVAIELLLAASGQGRVRDGSEPALFDQVVETLLPDPALASTALSSLWLLGSDDCELAGRFGVPEDDAWWQETLSDLRRRLVAVVEP